MRFTTQSTCHLVSLFALVALLINPAMVPAQGLSKGGQNQKVIHDYLFETFTNGRKTVYSGSGRDRGLKELTILKETREIRHGDELLLPAGAERVAVLFRHFAFHRADLERIKEVRVLPFSPDNAPPRSAQMKDFYRVQMRGDNRVSIAAQDGSTITSVQLVTNREGELE